MCTNWERERENHTWKKSCVPCSLCVISLKCGPFCYVTTCINVIRKSALPVSLCVYAQVLRQLTLYRKDRSRMKYQNNLLTVNGNFVSKSPCIFPNWANISPKANLSCVWIFLHLPAVSGNEQITMRILSELWRRKSDRVDINHRLFINAAGTRHLDLSRSDLDRNSICEPPPPSLDSTGNENELRRQCFLRLSRPTFPQMYPPGLWGDDFCSLPRQLSLIRARLFVEYTNLRCLRSRLCPPLSLVN